MHCNLQDGKICPVIQVSIGYIMFSVITATSHLDTSDKIQAVKSEQNVLKKSFKVKL